VHERVQRMDKVMRTLVLGLGNPLLGDDGVGWRVADIIQTQINIPGVEVDFHAGGGLSVMERLVGYDRAIIVDAIDTRSNPQGTVSCSRLEDLPHHAYSHLASTHETSLAKAIEVGRVLNAPLPRDIVVVTIESPQTLEFSERLSLMVASAMPQAIRLVLQQVRAGTCRHLAQSQSALATVSIQT